MARSEVTWEGIDRPLPTTRFPARGLARGVPLGILDSRFDVVDGLPMHARFSVSPVPEDRAPVVMVHGFLVSSRYMVPAAARLAPDFRVFAPDLPGFGGSPGPKRALDVPALADRLLHWLDVLGLERPVLMANSFGCQVVADLAARHPDRVDRVVLQGATVDPVARSAFGQIGRWLGNASHESLSLASIVARDCLTAGLRRAWGTWRACVTDAIEEKLPRLTMPVLVVRGARDLVAPQAWAEEMVRLLPRGHLRVVPGAPHTMNYSAPLELVRVVRPFLRGELDDLPGGRP